MIDYDYESRLVDRIAAREAIDATLTPRQKRILVGFRHNERRDETARAEAVSVTRIGQIFNRSLELVRARLAEVSKQDIRRNAVPPSFDRAAFLRHMQRLIELRATEGQRVFVAERAALEDMLWAQHSPPKPAPQYAPAPYVVHAQPKYLPPPLPTAGQLQVKADEALQYFLAARAPAYLGQRWLGAMCSRVQMPCDGGVISVAMDHLIAEVPPHADLSAKSFDVPPGTVGAIATNPYAALRVTLSPSGQSLYFDVTWDNA